MVNNSSSDEDDGWTVIEIQVPADSEDMASWVLIYSGATGCEVVECDESQNKGSEQAETKSEEENGNEPVSTTDQLVFIRASYRSESVNTEQLQKVGALLEEYGFAKSIQSMRVFNLPQEDWLAKWKEVFNHFQVGDSFLVCPVWQRDQMTDDQLQKCKIIYIDPGMAFGTGLHATTQFCLRMIEKYSPEGEVLDVGTGSGILAIATVLNKNSSRAVGLDTDPVAIENARKCMEANNLNDEIELVTASLEAVSGRKFNAILSNLTAEDILSLLPEYVTLLESNGIIICAGILSEKADKVETAAKNLGLDVGLKEVSGMWTGLVLSGTN